MTADASADAAGAASPRSLAWTRRRAALKRFVRAFRQQRTGMIGLGVLAFFIVLAFAAPLLFPSSELDVTRATGVPFSPPSAEYPFGPAEE